MSVTVCMCFLQRTVKGIFRELSLFQRKFNTAHFWAVVSMNSCQEGLRFSLANNKVNTCCTHIGHCIRVSLMPADICLYVSSFSSTTALFDCRSNLLELVQGRGLFPHRYVAVLAAWAPNKKVLVLSLSGMLPSAWKYKYVTLLFWTEPSWVKHHF